MVEVIVVVGGAAEIVGHEGVEVEVIVCSVTKSGRKRSWSNSSWKRSSSRRGCSSRGKSLVVAVIVVEE